MRRGTVASLLFIVIVALAALIGTMVAGNEPQLGLDLQGGTSVVLEPKNEVSEGVLNQSIAIIRNRVDALGVAEPDISRLGNNIIVQLPGVKDADRALQIVGQTAELRFRPVLDILPQRGSSLRPPPRPPPTPRPRAPPRCRPPSGRTTSPTRRSCCPSSTVTGRSSSASGWGRRS